MSMTELLVITVIIIFVLVLLDGLRRNWGDRRKRVVVKLDKKASSNDSFDDDVFISELPNGGARALQRDSDLIPRVVKPAPRLKSAIAAKSRPAAQEQSRNAHEKPRDVPVLLDAVELEEEEIEHTNVFADTSSTPAGESEDYMDEDSLDEDDALDIYAEETEEFIDGLDDEEDEELGDSRASDDYEDVDDGEYLDEDGFADDDDFDDDDLDDDDDDDEFSATLPNDAADDVFNKRQTPAKTQQKTVARPAQAQTFNDGRIEPGFAEEELDTYEFEGNFESAFTDDDQADLGQKDNSRSADKPAGSESRKGFGAGFLSKKDQGELFREEAAAAASVSREQGPQEVIIINVMAKTGTSFEGYELLPVLQLQGMRLGDMSIFHKHSGSNASGTVLFSMANMVKPGTFDLASMETFTTPGVSFFLQLPNKYGNMACFDQMLTAANALKHSLDGEVKDENRSVFTRQTMEHYRQRIRDFELKLLSRK